MPVDPTQQSLVKSSGISLIEFNLIYHRKVVAAIEPATNAINKIHTKTPAVKRKRSVRITDNPVQKSLHYNYNITICIHRI